MAMESLREAGRSVSADAEGRLAEHFGQVIASECGAVFVSGSGRIRGMACCAMTEPEVWDSRPSATVWFLYVRPEFRRHPAIALGLMRACLCATGDWGAERIRIAVDDGNGRLAERYEAKMGFRREMSCGIYSLELED
jgi:ribosomal protein S18 acetylase RimI-like enzyme